MLTNKLALITGSSSGIGLAVAKKFALNGANLVLVDVSPKVSEAVDELKSIGYENGKKLEVSTHVCDVANRSQVNQMLADVQAKHKLVPNVVVNSAGIVKDNFLVAMKEEEFDEVIRVNLKGTHLVTQAVSKLLLENATSEVLAACKSYCSIVNMASVIGKYGAMTQANYGASKAGVEGLSRSAAKELGRFKIRVNSILPGYIQTPMTDPVPDKYIKGILRTIALGRLGTPEDVTGLCLFLASDKSSYITGASIDCSGGMAF